MISFRCSPTYPPVQTVINQSASVLLCLNGGGKKGSPEIAVLVVKTMVNHGILEYFIFGQTKIWVFPKIGVFPKASKSWMAVLALKTMVTWGIPKT